MITPRVGAGGVLELYVGSKLERKRDNGSLTPQASSGPHYDPVGAFIATADVDPAQIAQARPLSGPEGNLRLTGLTPGTATVSVRGIVNDQWSEVKFEIQVVEVGALEYEIDTDMGMADRDGQVVRLARGFCYRRRLAMFDERGKALPSGVDLAPPSQRDFGCGPYSVGGTTLGRHWLPTIGKARPIELDLIEPTLAVEWNAAPQLSHDPDPETAYRVAVVAKDAMGKRIPLPYGLLLELAVETPSACNVEHGEVIHRAPHEECRVIVSVPRAPGEPALVLTSRAPNQPNQAAQ